MRTTLDLPRELVNDAMKATRMKTKTSVIVFALKEVIQKEKVRGIKDFRGKVNLNIDLKVTRDRK